MSKGLRNYPEEIRRQVAERRAKNNTKGCGYWAAMDFLNKIGPKAAVKAKKVTPSDVRRREKRAASQEVVAA